MRLLEVCVTTLENARAAELGGADRVELCIDLPAGGVTPPNDLLVSVVQALSIPVHVLVRPRAGSFVYSDQEIDTIRRQIDGARRAGASGAVLGILQSDSRVDVPATRALIELARPMKVTFHRAFDETADKIEALESVIRTGADCLLTSGGAPDVLAGAEEIARLREQAAGRLEIMPGGGLRLDSLSEVLRRSGAACVHGSFTWRDDRDRDLPEGERVERRVRQAVHMLRTIEVDQRVVE